MLKFSQLTVLWWFPVNSKGFGQMYTWILSPPDSPPIQAATWGWAESHVLYRRKTAECTCPFTDHHFLNWVSPHWTVRVFLASVILMTAKANCFGYFRAYSFYFLPIISLFIFPAAATALHLLERYSSHVPVFSVIHRKPHSGQRLCADPPVHAPGVWGSADRPCLHPGCGQLHLPCSQLRGLPERVRHAHRVEWGPQPTRTDLLLMV